jgi:hypothetical protein
MEESLAAVAAGMDLHGICLFPAVDMPDWHIGEWLHNGIGDLVEDPSSYGACHTNPTPASCAVGSGCAIESLNWTRTIQRPS